MGQRDVPQAAATNCTDFARHAFAITTMSPQPLDHAELTAEHRLDEPASPLLDMARLHQLVGRDAAVIAGVLQAFRESAEEVRVAMRQAAALGSLQAMANAAHGLRPGARSIGAITVADACAAIEAAAMAGTAVAPETLLANFETRLDAVIRWLDAL